MIVLKKAESGDYRCSKEWGSLDLLEIFVTGNCIGQETKLKIQGQQVWRTNRAALNFRDL